MLKYDLEKILNDNKELIDISKKIMAKIIDFEHNEEHIKDVLKFITELISNLEEEFDAEVCIISAFWHDVGRLTKEEGHEQLSAEMLKNEMIKLNYSNELIDKCYNAIPYHKWNMTPHTIEGKILKDADKLAWIGIGRWKTCLENNQKLDAIIELLPKLRNEILHFDYSRKIYDREIVNLLELLYRNKD